jgi:oligopeptide transport system substrate-binding protein
MRGIFALLVIPGLLASASCHKRPNGAVNVLVIGAPPQLRDPALGPLSAPDQVLLGNVAQGLVRFDPSGNIVSGLAERWTVTDDGLSYIFRLAPVRWPDGNKITAAEVARALKRNIANRSKNELKDQLGAVEDIVAMTDRVIQISLIGPRTDLLSLLAQPDMAILRDDHGTGPFIPSPGPDGELKLTRNIVSTDYISPEYDTTERQKVLLGGVPVERGVAAFVSGSADLVLGGTFADLPVVQHVQLPRGSLRFDPASGLFGLVPTQSGGALDRPEVRHLLSEAIDRDAFVAALAVPGLAPRATLLEPGLDGVPAPIVPEWTATAYANRVATLQAQAKSLFGSAPKPPIMVALPDGPGSKLLLQLLQRDWGALGFTVGRANGRPAADFMLIDEVAPSSSPSWFVRQFRCTVVPVCDPQADALMDGARQTPVPAQRYALLGQAAGRIDDAQLFIPIAAPVRWSLVSPRVQNFAGNRYGRHTLTDLEVASSGGE